MEEHTPANTPGTCPSTAPPAPQTEAMHILLRVMRRHHACVERHISERGIHHSQHRMLLQLARCQTPPSQRELAERMGITPAAVTTMLQKLEREGYVTRAATDEDNRRNEIRITDLGRAKILECREIFESVDRAMFEGLNEVELRTLSALIHRIDENLDALGVPDPCCRRRND